MLSNSLERCEVQSPEFLIFTLSPFTTTDFGKNNVRFFLYFSPLSSLLFFPDPQKKTGNTQNMFRGRVPFAVIAILLLIAFTALTASHLSLQTRREFHQTKPTRPYPLSSPSPGPSSSSPPSPSLLFMEGVDLVVSAPENMFTLTENFAFAVEGVNKLGMNALLKKHNKSVSHTKVQPSSGVSVDAIILLGHTEDIRCKESCLCTVESAVETELQKGNNFGALQEGVHYFLLLQEICREHGHKKCVFGYATAGKADSGVIRKPLLSVLMSKQIGFSRGVHSSNLIVPCYNKTRMVLNPTRPDALLRHQSEESFAFLQDGSENNANLVYLRHAAQEWEKDVIAKFSESGVDVDTINPTDDIAEVAATIGKARGVIALYSDSAFLAALLSSPKAVIILLSPPGVTNHMQNAVEQVLYLKQNVRIVNHKSYADSEQRTSTSYHPSKPFALPKREVEELHAEVMLVYTNLCDAPLPAVPPASPAIDPHDPPGYTTVKWLLRRTKYDPDHFAFGPTMLKGTTLHLHLYNTSDLFAPLVNGPTDPKLSFLHMTGYKGMKNKKTGMLIGETPNFGHYSENDDHYHPAGTVFHDEELQYEECGRTLPVGTTVFFHYPWVRDNVYHTHNDNLWPLFLTLTEMEKGPKMLILLDTHRSNAALPVFQEMCNKMFDFCDFWPAFQAKVSPKGPLCVPSAVWGRPRRQFSAHWNDVHIYANKQILRLWRQSVYTWYNIPLQLPTEAENAKVIVWLDRKKGQRVLSNSGDLVGVIKEANMGESVVPCCEGLSFSEQVRLMQRTDVLFGVHGAGLLHIAYLRERSVVVHISPQRLPYHEQVIIERMALLSNVVYMNTHLYTPPSQSGTWHSPSFSIPQKDLKEIVSQALRLHERRFVEFESQ